MYLSNRLVIGQTSTYLGHFIEPVDICLGKNILFIRKKLLSSNIWRNEICTAFSSCNFEVNAIFSLWYYISVMNNESFKISIKLSKNKTWRRFVCTIFFCKKRCLQEKQYPWLDCPCFLVNSINIIIQSIMPLQIYCSWYSDRLVNIFSSDLH